MKRLVLLGVLAFAGFASVSALAGPGHECKWCHTTTIATTTTAPPVATVTVTTPAPAPQTVTMTQTVTAPGQSQSQTVTVVITHGGVVTKTVTRTVVKTKVKKVRRYCTRQRHGWRCVPTAPHQKPLKG